MLACLDREPQTIARVSERIGRVEKDVRHHMKALIAFGIAEATGDDGEDGQPLYVTSLKDQPSWVTQAVNVRWRAKANK